MYPTTLPAGMPTPSTIPPPPSLPFFFRRRIARLDFTRLHSINLDHLIHSVDIHTLQHTLDNLAFSDLTPADLPQLTPAVLVKGWRLLQLTVEYLLHVQSFLYHAHATAQYECEVLARKCVTLKEQQRQTVKEKDKEARKLRKELRHAQQQMNTLNSFSPLKPPPPAPPAIADGAVHACSECHAAFISASYLASHVKRRHPHTQSPNKSSRRAQDEEKEQMSITVTSDSDSTGGRHRQSQAEREEIAKDKARLRQIEMELREEREQQRQRVAHMDQFEQRHRQADEQRDMRWQQQLKQQQSSLIAHLTQQQQQQQQVVSVEWLRDWQAEMQSMMESRLNDCFQREESKREARLMARLEGIEARVREVKSSEWEAGVRRVMAEIATLKADTARLIDVREERRKEEQQHADDSDSAAARERETREMDERRRREEEADALTQRALLLEQQRLELERSQDALHSHSPSQASTRPPRYPVIDSLPFLLARYPHSPATVERIVTGVQERATEVERRREAEGGVTDDELPDELKGVDRRVDEMVALHWREEEGQVERRVGLEERVRELEMERDRLRRLAEEDERRRVEEKREEEELEEAMRVLDQQKDDIERERAELNRRTEQEERRKDAELQAEIEREMQDLKRDQLVQQEKQKLAERQQQRDEQNRRDREDEQRWRAEEVAREQLRAATLTPTPPLTAASSIGRSVPPPLQMPLSRQQSSPSLPTPAFTTHVTASPLSAMSGVAGGMPTALFSLEARAAASSGVEEKQRTASVADDEDDEWGWEKDDGEQKQQSPLPQPTTVHTYQRPTTTTATAATFQPSTTVANDELVDDDALTAALFKRGAAGSGAGGRSPATLAERKQALMDKGFGLRLQTPQQKREEEEARRRSGHGKGGELVELDSGSAGSGSESASPVLQHPVRGRAHIAGGARHGGGRGVVAAFRPSSAASNASIVSGGSWDD